MTRFFLILIAALFLGCKSDASPEFAHSMRDRTVLVSTGLQFAHAYRSPNRIVTVKHGVKFGLAIVTLSPEIAATLESYSRRQADWAVFRPVGASSSPEWGVWVKHGSTNGKVYISTVLGIAQGKFVEEIWFHDSDMKMIVIDDGGQLTFGSSGAPVFNADGAILGLVRGRLGKTMFPELSGMVAVQPFRKVVEGN